MNKFNQYKRPFATALSIAVGAVGVGGCFQQKSMDELTVANGFDSPVTREKVGDGQFMIEAKYGDCTITLRTPEPWYEYDSDHGPTYVPNNPDLEEVPNATAEKLSELPASYDLEACFDNRLVR